MDQVEDSGTRGDDAGTISEDIGELCTIDDGVQFIENLSAAELVVIKNEEFYSLEEEADLIKCDPIEINPVNSTSVSSTQVVVKSEEVPYNETEEDSTAEDSTKVLPLAKSINEVQQKSWQKLALEEMFTETHYPDTSTKNQIASSLGLTYAFVQQWFKNRRRKEALRGRKTLSKKTTKTRSKDAGANTRTSGLTHRLSWSSEQLMVLERTFKRHPFPSINVLKSLTKRLGVEVKRIRNWFASRRYKIRMNPTDKITSPPKKSCLKSPTARRMSGSGKKSCIQLSDEQLEVLEKVFEQVRTLDQSTMEYLVEDLDLTPLIIEDWFRQRRQKVKATKIEKEILTPKKIHCAKSQTPSHKAESEDGSATDQSSVSSRNLQRSCQKPNDQRHSEDPVNGSISSSITYPRRTGLECQALHCEVCDRIRQTFKSGICHPCHRFMRRYRSLSRVKRKIAVPPCSHKGAQVSTGCKGCRLYRYQQKTKKQAETSDVKKIRMQPDSIKTAAVSDQKNSSAPQDTNKIVRRSDRLSFRQFNCCFKDREADSDEGTDEDFLGFNIPGKYPMDLQKKIHVTGKLNKLRMIASKLSNQKVMETKDRLVLSREIEGCVDDLLSLVLGSEPPSTELKANDESKKEERDKKEEKMKDECSRPGLEKKIQSLEELVEASASRILGLESKLQTPVRMETSTQTDAYLLYSVENPSVIHYRPSPLPDGLPYFRNNYSDDNSNIQSSTAAKNSLASTSHCLVCNQIRPRAMLSHNFICTYCQTFIDNQRMVSGPNPLVPRCSHGGSQVLFGCKDCLLFRHNRVKLGMMPTISQSELNSSHPLYETNYGCHVPKPMTTSNKVHMTHQLTGDNNSHFTQHSIPPSYMPPRETYLNYPQSGNVQSAVSATTQLSLPLSQGGSPSKANPQGNSKRSEGVLKPPTRRKPKKCPAVYGPSLHDIWCDGCQRRSACTRF
uniref:Double homeobox protein A n=2 Tax=Lygus hesperus TaxID=30085 RepID=A0A0A9WXT9_LYGHE